ncbi:MAG: peptidoglycan D,D-transpeptidase FtsI family protein [Nocardioides sp.]
MKRAGAKPTRSRQADSARAPAGPAAWRPMRRSRRTTGLPTRRLRVGLVLIAMVLSLYGGRLLQLQGVDPQSYAALAAAESRVTIPLAARRGEIVDRNGEPLATSVKGLAVAVDPALTKAEAPTLAAFLSTNLDVDYFTVLKRLRGEGHFAFVARQVPATQANDVVRRARELGYQGIYTEPDPVRDYPAHDVAANLVGFVGQEEPLAGLELAFNQWLSGTDGEEEFVLVSGGNRLPLGESSLVEPVDGRDVQLTIDRDLQWFTQRVLRTSVVDARADSGVAVVMDTRTGEVLSFADYPTFDAAAPDQSPARDRGSRGLSDVYEPGSVQKVLTLASLLDAGKVTPRTRIRVPGTLRRAGKVLHDWWEHGAIRLTMAGVIAQSSNIGTVLAADKLSAAELRNYLVRFGLGAKTDVGAWQESGGILPTQWPQLTKDRIAFGQSVSVNALQVAAGVNTIANGGLRVSPSLIRGAATADTGRAYGTAVAESRRVVSPRAARQTARVMERVLDPEDGVAPGAAVPGYRVAGKTGTAQRVVKGSYAGNGTVVSFAGFAPADTPRFTVYVVINHPRVAGGGGSLAGPVFAKLMSHVLLRYGVPPTGTKPSRLPTAW